MNLILTKTKICADKAGLALGLGFERVVYVFLIVVLALNVLELFYLHLLLSLQGE